MTFTVREVLEPLNCRDLQLVCRNRGGIRRGTTEELLTWLARSFKNDWEAVVNELRRQDLEVIARNLSHRLELPLGLNPIPVNELRSQLRSIFSATVDEKATHADIPSVELYRANRPRGDSATNDVQTFTIQNLAKACATAHKATDVSAYYSEKVLSELLKKCRGDVKVLLNGLGGERLKDQVTKLKELSKKLARHSKVEVRLGFAEGMFHTKLYLIEGRNVTEV